MSWWEFRGFWGILQRSLTEFGRTLMPVIEAMHRWGKQYAAECVKHKKQP